MGRRLVKVLVQGLRNIRNDDYQRGTEDYAMVISETFEYRREGPEEQSDWHCQAYCWCIAGAIVAKWKRKEGKNIYIVQKNFLPLGHVLGGDPCASYQYT
jgi:hypothetical protein